MSVAELPGSDALWDEWCEARAAAPGLRIEEFVARFGERSTEAFDLLATLLVVEEEAPLPSLVRVLRPDEDGNLRFADFTLLRELGEGSAGLVYEAIDDRPGAGGEHVALKLLNPSLGSGAARRDAILREARITARLEHPSIVRVVGSGVEQGYAWIATELVEGESIDRWIETERLPEERVGLAIEVGLQIASALEHAHERGVLHRDLKPSNVVRADDGPVKVLDFGLARREGAAFGVSHTGEVVGTPLYMAPEQLRGVSDLDGRADLYALGLVMLELATGKRLLVREGALKTLARIARGSGRFPGRFFAGLPQGFAGVLSRLLEPDRRDRYAEATALIGDLEALREGKEPRLKKLGPAVRFWHGVVRRPVRTAGVVSILGGLAWLVTHRPISVTIDSIESSPMGVRIDGRSETENLPLNQTFWGSGTHTIEFGLSLAGRPNGSRRTYTFPFEIEVDEDSASSFFLPFGTVYPWPRPLSVLPDDHVGGVAVLQVAVRPSDRSDHHQSYDVDLEIAGRRFPAVTGTSNFLLENRDEPYELHIEHEGMRPRVVTVPVTDGQTRTVMAELDPVDSPWHTILISSLLDPTLEGCIVRRENLALRWETGQRDPYTESLVHHVGLGAIDSTREGVLHFKIPLPVAAAEVQVLGIADPWEVATEDEPAGVLVEMGASVESLVPVIVSGFPIERPEGPSAEERDRILVNGRLQVDGTRVLHVRYRTIGARSWALLTNGLPRRLENGSIQWDPALRLRVRAVGTEAEPSWSPFRGESEWSRSEARQVIDLADEGALYTFDGERPGDLVPFTLATGGDADGDGTDDFALVLEPESEEVEIRSGRDGSTIRRLSGAEGDAFGTSLVWTPDLDNDGCAELLLGAIRHDVYDEIRPGYLALFSGSTGERLRTRYGTRAGDLFGLRVDFLGDIDGSGRLTAITSTNEHNAGGWGRVEVLSLPDLEPVYPSISGREQCDHLGNALAVLGDTNGDGFPDFAVGARDEDTPWWDSGGVYVYSGKDGTELLHVSGQCRFNNLGTGLVPAGDLDGDGNADFLTRTYKANGVFAFSGSDGELLRAFKPRPRQEGLEVELFESVSLVTDLDGDGLRDIAVHGRRRVGPVPEAEDWDRWIRFAIVFSADASRTPLLELQSAPGDRKAHGFQLTAVPDVGGDEREDLLVGMGRLGEEGRPRMLFVLSGK